ncbi:Glucan 1,3-beta-glucosidase-like protein 7 [Elsinoe fawcettii]|nr:Glucan 1,3-beta-glucosidase-like protein 7 [Elsinoe fawcettii]
MHLSHIAAAVALLASSGSAYPIRVTVRDAPLFLDGNSVGYATTDEPSDDVLPTPSASAAMPISTAPTYPSNETRTNATKPDKIRGVNLGGWLVLEKWMTPEVFQGAFADAKDQYTFDQIDGAAEALEKHWSTYITEDDIAKIASWGINTLRIPIGYWAYNTTINAPYKTGADKYLKDALEWARNNNLQVLIDLHGVPGSQNGFDNSGQAGQALWQKDNNMDAAVSALKQIADIYGTEEYSDVVWGIQLVNEPISWSDTVDPQKTHDWAKTTFDTLSESQEVPYKIIMHDAFETPKKWADLGKELNADSASDPIFWIDTHLYQNQVDEDSKLTHEGHVEKACKWSTTNLIPDTPQVPVIVGEFSAQTNVCVNPDGTSIAGKQCSTEGCQCSVDDMATWNQPMKDATTKFLEAELDTFEASAAGWFIWSYKAPGTWGLANLMEYGILGESVTDRKFPGQCKQYGTA